MKYQDILGVESMFDSTFNMTEEKTNYWKQFITNDKFESNLFDIINAFNSENSNLHKSIWVQGTYGTGKSHSTSVIKHILSDDISEIQDYVEKLKKPQLVAEIKDFRSKKRVFPVVLKGTNEITDSADMKRVIQREVSNQLAAKGINLSIQSDFEALIPMIDNPLFDSFWQYQLENNLKIHADSKEDLKRFLLDGDLDILKEIDNSLKNNGNLRPYTDNIVKWLTEVNLELRKLGIADYLVIFWDEFTSLLEITERRSILNTIQDIAELSKAPVPNFPDEEIGVYVFLVTHKNMEATDSFKDLKEDEKTMAKSRFLQLKYDMQDITTYHILSNAIKVADKTEHRSLIQKHIDENISIGETLDRITEQFDKPAETKDIIKLLYPFHPYTAYLATFVSRAIGSAERSIFEFLNDDKKGFKKFITASIEDEKFLTSDYVWDFFVDAFSEDRTNNFDAIITKYNMYINAITEHGKIYAVVFKVILLFNLLNRVTQSDNDFAEKNLVNPSEKNIISALSGAWDSSIIRDALQYIDEKEIIIKNPEGVFEISTSNMPQQRVQAAKERIYLKYEDISTVFQEYPTALWSLKQQIQGKYSRISMIDAFWGASPQIEKNTRNKFDKDYATQVALLFFRGETRELDNKLKRSEESIAKYKLDIEELSRKSENQNFVYVVIDKSFGNKAFEGFIDSRAREEVAGELQLGEEKENYRKKATMWIDQWKNEIISSSQCTIIFRGNRIDSTYSNAGKIIKEKVIPILFSKGLDKNPAIGDAATAWENKSAKATVQNVCFSLNRTELEEKMIGAANAVKLLLKDSKGNYIYDENLKYVGTTIDEPMSMLVKEIDDKISELKTRSVVDLGEELSYLNKPAFGYYSNYICMAAIALALRPYIDKIYHADQGSLVDKIAMKDIIVALFNFWEKGKGNSCLRVRFSTSEEKELVDLIQKTFNVTGDGIVDTKWKLRADFEKLYHSPIWTLKYSVKKNDEFNEIIDLLFDMVVKPNDTIDQNKISTLLVGLKKYRTDLITSLNSAKTQQYINEFISSVLKQVNFTINDTSNLLEFLKQTMQEEIVYWGEKTTKDAIIMWCALQNGSKPHDATPDIVVEPTDDDDESDISDVIIDEEDETPEFEPVVLTPIGVTGKIHNTIESATSKIKGTEFDSAKAQEVLVSLCEQYPVICEAIIALLDK